MELAKDCFLFCLELLHVVETDDEKDEELLFALDQSLELDVCETSLHEVLSSLSGPRLFAAFRV